MSVITSISIYRIITISINAGSPRLKEISLLISSPSSFCFFSPFYGKMPWKNYLLVFLLPRGHWWEERELQIWWMFFYHYLMLLPICMWHSHLNLRFKPFKSRYCKDFPFVSLSFFSVSIACSSSLSWTRISWSISGSVLVQISLFLSLPLLWELLSILWLLISAIG